MKLFSRAFWEFALERAVKTGAQTAVSLLTVDYAGLLNVDYKAVGSAVLLSVLASVLTALSTFQESAESGPDPLPNPDWAEQPEDESVAEPVAESNDATQVFPTV